MKWRAICEYPAQRGVYVEAIFEEQAEAKIRGCVAIIYGCRPADVIIYNLCNERENPAGVLRKETGWRGTGDPEKEWVPISWDENPLILYKNHEPGRAED
ncbi:MAG: hypothetical protein ACK5HY_01325 [Parahaliea sp.]